MTHKTPYPYQEEGARWLAQGRRRFLADDMGLGKTAQGVLAADLVGAESVLVVCPGVVKRKWVKEFDAFSPWGRPAQAIMTSADPVPNTGVVTVSYDLLRSDKLRRRLYKAGPWDVVIADEAHYLKERSARRTKLMYGQRGVVDRARYYWPLSATPTPNHYTEWWPHLRKFGYADRWPEFWMFERYFCKGWVDEYGGFHITGGKNQEQLREILSRCMLRRMKSEVLPDLPPLRVGERYLDLPKSLPAGLHDDTELAENLTAALAEGPEAVSELVAPTLRRMWGMAKVEGTVAAAREWLEDCSDKLVIYGYHPIVLDAIAKGLSKYKPAVIHGKTRGDGSEQVERFGEDPTCRVFVGQLSAAGVGIDLVAASTIWIAESDWSPENNRQVIDRLRRIGQTGPVLAEYLMLPGTLDEQIQAAWMRKAEALDELYAPDVAKNETPEYNVSPPANAPISVSDL